MLKTKKSWSFVDPLIRPLVIDLNEAGWITTSSCQGKRTISECREGGHDWHSWLYFACKLPRKIHRELLEAGFNVYGLNWHLQHPDCMWYEGFGIQSFNSPKRWWYGRPRGECTFYKPYAKYYKHFIAQNKTFEERVRKCLLD